jgi:hypothetical protein
VNTKQTVLLQFFWSVLVIPGWGKVLSIGIDVGVDAGEGAEKTDEAEPKLKDIQGGKR